MEPIVIVACIAGGLALAGMMLLTPWLWPAVGASAVSFLLLMVFGPDGAAGFFAAGLVFGLAAMTIGARWFAGLRRRIPDGLTTTNAFWMGGLQLFMAGLALYTALSTPNV